MCDHVTGSCKCNEYWTGDTCDIDVDECANVTCGTNENCTNNIGENYTCDCVNGAEKESQNKCGNY